MGTERYVAFLRGINLGNRRLKMESLRGHFEELGWANVATFLASGNVVFEVGEGGADRSSSDGSEVGEPDLRALEGRIEGHLGEALGYDVAVHVRRLEGLEPLITVEPVSAAEDEDFTPHVIFLRREPDDGVKASLTSLETSDDRFFPLGREVFWLRGGGLSDSTIETRHLESALGGMANTMRTLNTVRRIYEKFAVTPP